MNKYNYLAIAVPSIIPACLEVMIRKKSAFNKACSCIATNINEKNNDNRSKVIKDKLICMF